MFSYGQGFQNATFQHEIDVFHDDAEFGNGVSFADFNADGWDDLSFATIGMDPKFYVNNEGTYEEIDLGITSNGADMKAIIWVDYDNDGDKDLFLSTSFEPLQLFQNDGDLNLTNVAASAGLNSEVTRNFGACWVDYNKDGWLDLYVCKYHNPDFVGGYAFENHLYKSNQDGTFTELANFLNVDDGVLPSFQSVFSDFDGDGWEDLYVINDRDVYPNNLYKNMEGESFENVGIESGVSQMYDAMCITVGDYDNDGDIDIYVTNSPEGNKMYRNLGDGTFEEVASELGLEVNQICWGSLWIDYNNDMWQDLYVCAIYNLGTTNWQNTMYKNVEGVFEDVSTTVVSNDVMTSFSVAQGDYNNDGFPDFVQNNQAPSSCALWRNGTGPNNWLKVSVEGVVSNKDAIGTRLDLYVNDISQVRTYQCGEGYLAQDSERKIFGLGSYDYVDSLLVTWPNGLQETYFPSEINTTIHLVEGQSLTASIVGTNTICGEEAVELGVSGDWETFQWSNGEETATIEVDTPGLYSVVVTNSSGFQVQSDTTNVTVYPALELNIGTDDVSCFGYTDGFGIVSVA
ncbi:MAG: CRTAC1 family protein, partial [Bacteroidota bacterium]